QPIRTVNAAMPEWLCDLIDRLLAKEAHRRFASAREVADLLGGYLAGVQQPIPVPSPTAAHLSPPAEKLEPEPPVHPSSRRLWLLIACLAGVLLVLGAIAAWLRERQEPQPGNPDNTEPLAPVEFRREDIPPHLLALAGGGDPAQAPPELGAVL